MSDIKATSNLVHEILKESEKARNSDNYLLYAVYSTLGRRKGIDIDKMSVPHFFLHLREYGLPTPETIRRTRQKLQATYPDLIATAPIEAMREVKREDYRNYARSIKV